MKTFKFAFLFFAILSIAACADDDEGTSNCTQADWVGTYTGTQNCDGVTEDVTVTITASGTNNIVVAYVTPTSSTTFDPLPFTNCDLIANASGGGFTVAVDADLNGNELSVIETISDSTTTSTCTLMATRN